MSKVIVNIPIEEYDELRDAKKMLKKNSIPFWWKPRLWNWDDDENEYYLYSPLNSKEQEVTPQHLRERFEYENKIQKLTNKTHEILGINTMEKIVYLVIGAAAYWVVTWI